MALVDGPPLHWSAWDVSGPPQPGAGSARMISLVSNGCGRYVFGTPRSKSSPRSVGGPKTPRLWFVPRPFAFWSGRELQSFVSCVKNALGGLRRGVIYYSIFLMLMCMHWSALRCSSLLSLYGIWSYLATSSGFDNSSLHTHDNLAHS